VGEGGVAVLYFAYRLIQFPLGIFSNALSQAILPTFSEQALEPTRDSLERTLSFSLRAVFFVMLPASAGLMVLSVPIVLGLFGGGKFDAYSANLTSRVLFFYSIGLCAYGANKVLQSCFFALKDTLTPAKISSVTLIMNIVLNVILMFPLKISGLALATSISGIITTLVLFFILNKRLNTLDIKTISISFARIFAASVCMGAVCFLVAGHSNIFGNVALGRLLNLGFLLSLGSISYVAFCFVFRVKEMRELWLWVAKKLKVKVEA
jgi:putative peptidoglycan lipid II flippase